ncbi:MAG TPA: hypothetical protein VIF09_05755 [Polyangiaceae bacterium]|jgi:hypothetical protein
MRAALSLLVAVASASLACTYDVPRLQQTSDASASNEGASTQPDGGGDEGGADSTTPEAGPDAEGGAHPCTGALCPCQNSGNCAGTDDVCALQQTVGAALFAAAGANFCTKPCCTSGDCDPGTVCFASGQGGNYCVNPSWLSRSTAQGQGLGGATCSAGSDCRSGLCTGAGICGDTCCSFPGPPAECASGTQCAFGNFPGAATLDRHFAAFCGLPGGALAYGDACSGNNQCSGGLCYESGGSGNCTRPCGSADECGAGNGCQLDQQGSDIYAACFPATGGQEGANCSNDGQCLGAWCGAGNMCTNICYSDSACTVVGWRCLPQADSLQTGNYLVLACGKP